MGLMPTGGGKSITFQVPALAKEGLCIVITPLIALMKDQVQNLRNRAIKATAIYSGMTHREILTALDNCIYGDYKFLYISPERLATDLFKQKLKSIPVSMITVDESHCISQWGYDFRPAYLQIADIRELLPGIPVLALTATATPEVVKDIQEKLHFQQENVFRMSFERKNLAYVTRKTDNKDEELIHILQRMKGSAIVYVRSRRKAKEITELLLNQGISANFYHAGLDNAVKDQRQKEWQQDNCRVMVATNAFGMGIDKPDVRLVIHYSLPDSPEAYFQEAGRAGRDGEKAYAVVLHASSDVSILKKRINDNFPDKAYIQQVYEHVQYYLQMAMGDGLGCTREFNLEEFCHLYKHFPVQADSALRILTQAGFLEYTDEQDNASRVLFTIGREELYRLREMEPETERLMHVLLRMYTGIFTDYAYISEDSLAIRSRLTRQQVYQILVSLSKQGIVSYIPRKKTPFIIYTRERVEASLICIPKEVYEDRKERYTQRIESMIEYVNNTTLCRSRILLNYFGEKETHNCGQCDVCLRLQREKTPQKMQEMCREQILALLASAPEPLSATDLLKGVDTEIPSNVLEEVLEQLLEEECIAQENGLYTQNPTKVD